MLWDRGYWAPEDGADPPKALEKGELKFVLEGERLHGGWVLVRMKDARARQAPQLAADQAPRRRGAAPATTKTCWTRTARSPRAARWTQIAAGKGTGAEAVHDRAKARGRPTRSGAPTATAMATAATRPSAAQGRPRAKAGGGAMPGFVEPQLASLVERPPQGAGWAHEIKFDGYRMQLRVEGGEARLRTRKGLDWTERFPRSPRPAPGCRRHHRRRGRSRSTTTARRTSPALQAALSDGRTRRRWSSSCSTCCSPAARTCAPAADRAQGAAEGAAGGRRPRRAAHPLRRALRDRRRRGAALGLPHGAGRHRLQAARRALPLRPRRRPGPSPSAAPARRW